MNLTIIIGENKNNWNEGQVAELFDLLSENPFFQDWGRMHLGLKEVIVMNYDKKEAIKKFNNSQGEYSVLFDAEKVTCEAIISRLNSSNMISLKLDEQMLLGSTYQLFLDFMLEIASKLPNFRRLTGMAGYDYNELYEKYNLKLVKCCGILKLSWVHVLDRSEYEGFISKADLLETPAFLVKELENDAILIQVYENPFEYENETSIAYMRNVTEHLRAKRFW